MRAIQVKEYVKVRRKPSHPSWHLTNRNPPRQGPHELTVSSLPDPNPSPSQYLIAIHATATNFFDLLQIRGKYQHQPPLPWISGSEFAGIVLSTPTNTPSPKHQVGDRVFGASQGGYATRICAEEERLRPVPPDWGFLDAAGLMVTAPTSYAALVAKAFGATVIATAGSARKLQVAKRFGADYGVDYTRKGWEERVKELTPGVVVWILCLILWNGRILIIGFAAGDIEKVAMNRVLLKNVSLVGLHWGMYAKEEPETVESVWEGLFKLMREGKFKGTGYTDKRFVGLESVGEALGSLWRRDTWGKVVITVPQDGESKL
ncbi:zinc-binding alcohol dehydrogenase [Physcia stellaris]|nr:zinc-binding alcohol dehydrogenase [Physcia stellaris]